MRPQGGRGVYSEQSPGGFGFIFEGCPQGIHSGHQLPGQWDSILVLAETMSSDAGRGCLHFDWCRTNNFGTNEIGSKPGGRRFDAARAASHAKAAFLGVRTVQLGSCGLPAER